MNIRNLIVGLLLILFAETGVATTCANTTRGQGYFTATYQSNSYLCVYSPYWPEYRWCQNGNATNGYCGAAAIDDYKDCAKGGLIVYTSGSTGGCLSTSAAYQ